MNMKEMHAMLDGVIRDAILADSKMEPYHQWTYKDLPRITPKLMEEFRELVGEDNIYWITYADYGESVRGQILISPDGMDRLDQYNSANK